MRKITSKKTGTKRKQVMVGVALVFVMLASTFGILTNSFGTETNSGRINYNGFEFFEQNGFWITQIEDRDFIFRKNPIEVGDVANNIEVDLEDYYNKPLYIDSEDVEVSSEIYNNLNVNGIVMRTQAGCFEEPCKENVPIKTCEDNLIVIHQEDYSSIVTENNCVFIKGPEEDLIKITDGFLFKLLGIE